MLKIIQIIILLFLSVAIVMGQNIEDKYNTTLKIGLASSPTSANPYAHLLTPNIALSEHIFDSLTQFRPGGGIAPELAISWSNVDDTTWIYNLRKDVLFSDGSKFDAYSVVYSICKILSIKGSPSSFVRFVRHVKSIEVIDPYTIKFVTNSPYPYFPFDTSSWSIISEKSFGIKSEQIKFNPKGCSDIFYPSTADFNAGIVVGTGAFVLKKFSPTSTIYLERNKNYWGDKNQDIPWSKVEMTTLSSNASRSIALIAGDLDVIEMPSPQDINLLLNDENSGDHFNVARVASQRVMYLQFDHFSDIAPNVYDLPSKGNPFKNILVRRAVSLAIDRNTIVSKIMQGAAVAAGEMLPNGLIGTLGISPDEYNPKLARKLLSQAGYGDGFSVVLGAPNDRYVNDYKVAQAIAQYLSKVGIKTRVEALTKSQHFKRRNNNEYSLFIGSWGAATGDISSSFVSLLTSKNYQYGTGGVNVGGYHNEDFDNIIFEALSDFDPEHRKKLLEKANTIVTNDKAILPLYFEEATWAMNGRIEYKPRSDQMTLAKDFKFSFLFDDENN